MKNNNVATKTQKEFPEFVNEVANLSVGDLNNRLLALTIASADNDTAQENDEELEEAKEKAAFFAAPYRDARKAVKLKTRYILSLLEGKQEKAGE
jgi:hypothetical protein